MNIEQFQKLCTDVARYKSEGKGNQAMAEIYKYLYPKIQKYLRKKRIPERFIEDISQVVFMSLYKVLINKILEQEIDIGFSYFWTIVDREIVRFMNFFEHNQATPTEETLDEIDHPSLKIEDILIEIENKDNIEKIIKLLTDKQKLILIMRLEGYTSREIMEKYGVSIGVKREEVEGEEKAQADEILEKYGIEIEDQEEQAETEKQAIKKIYYIYYGVIEKIKKALDLD